MGYNRITLDEDEFALLQRMVKALEWIARSLEELTRIQAAEG